MAQRTRSSRKSGGGRRQGARGGAARGNRAASDGRVMLYGQHAVLAALANPKRRNCRLSATRPALAGLAVPDSCEIQIVERSDLDSMLPPDTPHQGLVLQATPLEDDSLHDVLEALAGDEPALIVVLDQITDPQNVGAILRSAAAFGATAVVATERNSALAGGALAKAASGALEIVPFCRETNLARALDQLADAGFWRIGLDGEAGRVFNGDAKTTRLALVLGAEGAGLRRLTREHCDELAGLPMSGHMESLNVSNAAAVAMYEARRDKLLNTDD
ncbi:MAG: 23S rRNA (guanosine(2251)-2'-O)-methyltransferase RlmB [Rhodospirillales bacterium]